MLGLLSLIKERTPKRDILIDSLLLLLLAFIPFLGMGTTGIWLIHDQSFPLYPVEQFLRSLKLWNAYFCTGYFDVAFESKIVWHLLQASLAYCGIPTSIVQRILLISPLVLSGWGIYYLMRTIFPHRNQPIGRIACIASSTFYMINPFITYWMFLGSYPLYTMSILPFMLTFLYKGFKAKEKKDLIKYASFTAFSSVFLLTTHPEITVLMVVFLGLYILYYTMLNLVKHQLQALKCQLRFLFIAALMSFALNLFWILPLGHMFFLTDVIQPIIYSPDLHIKRANFPAITIQMLRLQLFEYTMTDHQPLPHWIRSPLSVLTGLVLSCLMFSAIILKKRHKHVVFFAFVTIVSMCFATGLNSPLGSPYVWLWKHSQILKILIDPFKFLLIASLGYSILLGISTAEIYGRLSKLKIRWKMRTRAKVMCAPVCIHTITTNRKRTRAHILSRSKKIPSEIFSKSFICLVFFLILLHSYPLLSGNLYGLLDPVHVPDYYFEARDWLKQQEGDFRVMMMPQMRTGCVSYTWIPQKPRNPYYMTPLFFTSLTSPVPVIDWVMKEPITGVSRSSALLAQKIYSSILNNDTRHAGKMLSLLNIKYVLVADDRLRSYTMAKVHNCSLKPDTSYIKSVLERQEDVQLVKSFGELHFYENRAYENIQIYGTSNTLNYTREGYLKISQFEDFHPSQIVLRSSSPSSWRIFHSCNGTNNWREYCATSFTVDSTDFKEGNSSLKVSTNASPSDLWLSLYYDPPGVWNWSEAYSIKFWFKASSSSMLRYRFACFGNDTDRYYVWDFDYEKPNIWKQMEVVLSEPTGVGATPPNLAEIDKIQFAVWLPSASNLTFWIDGIEVSSFVLPEDYMGKAQKNPLVSYEESNPTRYIVEVTTETPFFLVLSESYDLYWSGRIVDGEKISEVNHFMVNYYSNGWYVEETGEFTIVLEYELQKYFDWGIKGSVVSAVVLLACLAFSLGNLWRGRSMKSLHGRREPNKDRAETILRED